MLGLERLLVGWRAKFLVLVLLGFAATDYVITQTLSAADAAEHLIHNPKWAAVPPWLHSQMTVTMLLLVMLGAMFMRGFREVIGLAVVIVGAYLVLNAIVIGSAVYYLVQHPELLQEWVRQVEAGAIDRARRLGCDVVCCGHTHFADTAEADGVTYFNSGCWTESPCSYLTVACGDVRLRRSAMN